MLRFSLLGRCGMIRYVSGAIADRQRELRRDPKVRRLLRLYHLLGNDQQLEKWQRFISPSSDFSFGTSSFKSHSHLQLV